MIYLDSAAATLHKPRQVIDAVVSAMQSMGNSSRGTHAQSLAAARSIYETRCKAARLEAGTMNGHGPVGLSAALDFILETGVEEIHNKEIALMRRFIYLSFFFFSCNPYNKQSRKIMMESMTENMTG